MLFILLSLREPEIAEGVARPGTRTWAPEVAALAATLDTLAPLSPLDGYARGAAPSASSRRGAALV